MTLGEMIALYRAQAGDTAQPYFCDDELLAIYANEAQMEACRRGQLLLDASRVQLQAGQELVKLAPTALRVTRAFVDGHAVSWISAEHMDGLYPGWQFDDPQRQVQHLVFGVGESHGVPRNCLCSCVSVQTSSMSIAPRPSKKTSVFQNYAQNATVDIAPRSVQASSGRYAR